MNRRNRNMNLNDNSAMENLDEDTQHILLRAFEDFYAQESEVMISALNESREELKNSMLELCVEQDKYKDELMRVSAGKFENSHRKKENAIPLSEYLRRKRGLPPKNPDVFKSAAIAHAYNDREAVEKYLRRRERQRQADENRVNREITDDAIENETQKILDRMNAIDLSKEKERERQMEKIQAKLRAGKSENSSTKDEHQIANEIIENYQDSKFAYERDKLAQQEKIKARLSAAARDRGTLTPTGRDINDQNIVPIE